MKRALRTLSAMLWMGLAACDPETPPPPPEPEPEPEPELRRLPSAEITFLEVESDYDQADYCQELTKRHAVVRDLDMVDGDITWRCGDVKGVQGQERGLEYCEYMAVSNGNRVDQLAQAAADQPLFCLFTSVFEDSFEDDQRLANALALPENLGAVTDPALVRMTKVGFNARSAADGLIDACGQSQVSTANIRNAACFLAALEAEQAGDLELTARIDAACREVNLDNDEVFAAAEALGVTVRAEGDAGFQEQSEIASCLFSSQDPFFTITNADNTICGRTLRAGSECGCDWNAIPTELPGFLFTEWLTPDIQALPPECRRAKVDGADYDHLMICEVPQAEVEALAQDPVASADLQAFCDTRFGQKIAVRAPLRALQLPGSCRGNTEFCTAFTNAE